uniref:Myb/SANT-like DNA-binding domain-containing protein n=1 Tax=Nothobranchius pienaari TaxID=704102 RepID=A0A1A8MVD7_9TELE
MEANLQGGDISAMHVKTEAAEESSSAPLVGSQESPAPCGDGACRGGGLQQTAEELTGELQAATTAPPVLLYPVSSDRFFTTSADGKTYLKIAPAAVLPPAPAEKTLSTGSDFSSKAVLCLIEAVGRRWGLYETRERSQLFQSVQEEMASKGHILPVEKIRRKWNNLIVTYKRVKDRSRETGHAKTSWEFFDLMDATLCDTIGTQIINNKRNKGGTNASAQPGPSTKITSKPGQLPPPTTIVHPTGDFSTTGGAEPATSQVINSTAASTSQSAATISAVKAPELKPLIVLNGDVASSQPATVVPASTFISSPCFTETTSTSSSLVSTSSTDLNVPSYKSRKTSSFTSGLIPFCLSTAPLGHNPNVLGLSSLPPTSSCHTPSIATSLSPSVLPGIEEQGQKGNKEQTSIPLFQEILKRQEEQAYLDRVTRRRVEAREKRRERREVRMSESLGRIATALELLSSKQDTVIALLQRLADRK